MDAAIAFGPVALDLSLSNPRSSSPTSSSASSPPLIWTLFGAGQTNWVMTIGGYHSAFVVPAHYPRPDRLRISWSINSSLSATGEAYFVITPKFDAAADFLMTYSPFHFIADVKLPVGVRYSMDIWFVTVHIAVEIAASISLMGPPLRGIVHVDFWVFGFDIAFGDSSSAIMPPAVLFEDFWNLVTQAESSSTVDAQAGKKEAHLFSCTKGLVTENKEDIKAADLWLIRSGIFRFTIECQFAIKLVTVNEGKAPAPQGVTIDDIYAKLMRLSDPIDPTLSVAISGPENSNGVGWKEMSTWKDVPQVLWGKCNESKDPNTARPGSDFSNLLNSGGSVARLLMGVVIEVPAPQV
ncbi:hypothetical protein F4782DRAFT_545352 [Xylaria castorea]|nr:hypothetical protein F4782DRAFT_545352 [Xylaria castorea]